MDEVMDAKKDSLLKRGLKSVGRNARAPESGDNDIDHENIVLLVKKRKR
jgi:hypothetical protein